MSDARAFATWEEANERFRSPLCCPEPDCGEPIPTLASPPPQGVADRCPKCGKPFERNSIRTQPGAPPIEIARRVTAGFCTMTGQELTVPSCLDWAEAGGGPGRTGCLPDARGAFFGRPNPNTVIHGALTCRVDDVFGPDREGADPVRSILVVRGRLVVTSAGGRTAILRTEDLSSVLPAGECLDWPDGTADAAIDERSVSQSAAVRGGHLCIVAAHQLAIRDIREYLGRPARGSRSVMSVVANEDCRFLGPPLGIDAERPLFAVLEGRDDDADGVLSDPAIRVVDATGTEVSVWDAPGIVRPPVYDRLNQVLVWVTETGAMNSVPLAQILRGGGFPISSEPGGEFSARFDSRSTLLVAPNLKGWAEVWMADNHGEEDSFAIWSALLQPRANPQKYGSNLAWKWRRRDHDAPSGRINGFAVGQGGGSAADSAADLAAVTSDEGVFGLRKSTKGVLDRDFTDSTSGGSIRGSADPPILCSAGIVARTNLGVYVNSRPVGWSQEAGDRFIPLASTERRRQGLAMLGRRVFVGHGTGVVAIDLEPKECG